MDSKKLALLCREFADNKKAENIIVLDVRKLSSVTDYFVIASGTSQPHLRAIVEDLLWLARADAPVADDALKKKPFGFLFWFALGFLGVVLLSAVFANLLPLQNPNFQNYTALNQGPSSAHLLGTDDLGRDLLARLVFGARVSLIVGFFGVAIGLVFGGYPAR